MSHAEVVVIGAGLAGLSAAVALTDAGCKPLVLERKPYVGGRAYSYEHPALGEVIDSQHVLLGCCTNLLDLCRRAGAADHIRWYDEIPFLEPGGRASRLQAGPGPGALWKFLQAPMLSLKDKFGIARGLAEFLRSYPSDDSEPFSEWLKRTHQTSRSIQHFWEPIVVATLNDGFEHCSTKYAGQVFHEAFVKSAEGGRMGVPTEPLSEFYARVARFAEGRGAEIRLRASVDKLSRAGDAWHMTLSDGSEVQGGAVVVALPFEQTAKLIAIPNDEWFSHAPITTIHLWFDRDVTEVDQCALLGTRIQWMFNKTRIRRAEPQANAAGQYLELVISASFPELKMGREEILSGALRELALFFPRVSEAVLLKSGVLKEARATFSVTPGLDRFRPASAAGDRLFLAGDWTQSGWPSTMEGAVRSGRIAAEALTGMRALVSDLPGAGLMRWIAR